jgi:hypothetical protein
MKYESEGESLSRRRLMSRRIGVLVLLFTLMCGMGLAQGAALDSTPPSRAQVLKLMSAMGVQEGVDRSLKSAQEKIKLAARSSFQKKNPDADAATLKKLDAVFDTTPIFSFEGISEMLIPVYQKNLSASDVQAGIDFYSSEAGKRLLENLPKVIRESNESGGPVVQQKMKAYSEALKSKLEAIQSEVNKQTPPAAQRSKASDDKAKTTDQKSK